ncbi:hypothetical protein ACIRF8_15105 [Streptomyces sp. NPDC102406]
MSTESTTKQAAPLRCTRCGNTAGPFDTTTGRCETCTEAAA